MAQFGDDYLDNVIAAARAGMVAAAGCYDQQCDGLMVVGDVNYFLHYALTYVFRGLAVQYGKMVVFFNSIGDTELSMSCARKQAVYLDWAQQLLADITIPGNVYDRMRIRDVVTAVIT